MNTVNLKVVKKTTGHFEATSVKIDCKNRVPWKDSGDNEKTYHKSDYKTANDFIYVRANGEGSAGATLNVKVYINGTLQTPQLNFVAGTNSESHEYGI